MREPARGNTFTQWPLAMKSGLAVAQTQTYHAIETKPGYFCLYGDCPNPADHLYCGSTDPNTKSDGFGGAALRFRLVDGSVLTLYGPWKTNCDAFKEATGLDLSDKHATRGVIALSKRRGKGEDCFGPLREYVDVQHVDEDWVIGSFDRVDELARNIANEIGQSVVFWTQTQGGAHGGRRDPTTSAA